MLVTSGKPRAASPRSIAAIPVVIPAAFYLRFGYIDGYALAFTAFLVLLALAVEFLPRNYRLLLGARGVLCVVLPLVRTQAGTHVNVESAFVYLSDGRRLTRSPAVPVQPGPARLLILRGFGRVIGAE